MPAAYANRHVPHLYYIYHAADIMVNARRYEVYADRICLYDDDAMLAISLLSFRGRH